jgi:arylsulfatase
LGVRCAQGDGRTYSLTIDGEAAGSVHTFHGFATMISFSGLDIGLDRGSPVADYAAPFQFTGKLRKVTVVMDEDQSLDDEAVGATEMARQ